MAKRPHRTKEQQEYRDNLARDLKSLRTRWETGKELAEALLDDQKNTPEYIISKYGYTNKWAKQLIDAGHGSYLISNWRSFWNQGTKLNKEVAVKLLENGLWDDLRAAQRFHEWLWFEKWDNEFAIKLIENWYLDYVWYAINNFDRLNKEILFKLIDILGSEPMLRARIRENFDKFEWLDLNEVLIKLYECWKERLIGSLIDSSSLGKFEWLNQKHADKLIEYWKCWIVFYNMDKFDWLNQGQVAKKMIEEWKWHDVAVNIHVFKLEYYKEIADALIDSWNDWNIENMLKILNRYKWLNHEEIADKLFKIWKWYLVGHYLNSFKLNREEMLKKFIEYEVWSYVARHLKEYTWLSNDIANKLIQKNRWDYVGSDLDRFERLEDTTIVNLINSLTEHDRTYWLPSALIKNWYWKVIAENLDKFENLDEETRRIIVERYWKNS